MKTRISPKLQWLAPYLEVGIQYISRKHKIERLGVWNIEKSRGKNEAAAIFQTKLGQGHRIWMHTHLNKKTPYSKIEMLVALAHELAHTEDWKHTPKHKRLESKILKAFMDRLESEGYVSEEKELA